MKNTIIAIVVIIVLALGFWWWKTQQSPVLETVPQEEQGVEVKVNGEVQGEVWEATGKDGSAELPN